MSDSGRSVLPIPTTALFGILGTGAEMSRNAPVVCQLQMGFPGVCSPDRAVSWRTALLPVVCAGTPTPPCLPPSPWHGPRKALGDARSPERCHCRSVTSGLSLIIAFCSDNGPSEPGEIIAINRHPECQLSLLKIGCCLLPRDRNVAEP